MAIPSVAVIDNFDSFTFNLVHYLEKITGKRPAVFRNDVPPERVRHFDALLFSPGPGLPSEAGHMIEVIRQYASNKKILGVCLGHQAIGTAFGASLINLNTVLHGVSCTVKHYGNSKLFHDVPVEFTTGHYHSWVISREHFPEELEVIAEDSQGNIMAISHQQAEVCGIQFHPESVMTPCGLKIIENWILK